MVLVQSNQHYTSAWHVPHQFFSLEGSSSTSTGVDESSLVAMSWRVGAMRMSTHWRVKNTFIAREDVVHGCFARSDSC